MNLIITHKLTRPCSICRGATHKVASLSSMMLRHNCHFRHKCHNCHKAVGHDETMDE